MPTTYQPTESVIDVRPLGDLIGSVRTNTLVKTRGLRVIRLIMLAGNELPLHESGGELTLQCVEGKLALTLGGTTREIPPGHFLFVPAGAPHSLRALEDSSAIVTFVERGGPPRADFDAVQEASEESFPASDPPANTPIMGP